MNLLKHPLFQINMIIVCSLVLIELLHVNYHRTAPPCPVQQIEMEVPMCGCNVDELLQFLYGKWAELEKWDSVIRIAVDHDYVDRTFKLRNGHVVALMPPMQGG